MTEDIIKDIRRRCRLAMNGVVSSSMRSKGLDYKLNFGVSLQKIKELAASYQPTQELAEELWKTNTRELMIMATLLYPISEFKKEDAERWAKEIPNPEIREQLCFNLFQNLPFASNLVFNWIQSIEKELRITGYMLFIRLLVAKKVEATDISLKNFPLVWKDVKSMDLSLANASLQVLKRIGRISQTKAQEILDMTEELAQVGGEREKEICESLKFEFEYYER